MRKNSLLFIHLLLLGVVLGICTGRRGYFSVWFLSVWASALFGSAILFIRRERPEGERCLFLLLFLLGCMRMQQAITEGPADIRHFIGQDVFLQGVVAEEPSVEMKADHQTQIRYIVRDVQIKTEQKYQQVQGGCYLYAKSEQAIVPARIGDQLSVAGKLNGLHDYKNPGRVDKVAAAGRQGIYAAIHSGKSLPVVELKETAFFQRWIASARARIRQTMENSMDTADAAVIFAMLFGGYTGIRQEVVQAFSATGIIHILSVSGSHISLLAGTLKYTGDILRLPRMLVGGMVIAAISLYTIFSGCAAPVLRAAVMGIGAFCALLLGRESDAKRWLALTAIGFLLYEPELLFDISFQLSFGATAGLLYFSPCFQKMFSFLPPWLAGSWAVTAGAQCSVLPLLAWYFHMFPLASFFANCLAVPLLEYIIMLALFACCIGLIFPAGEKVLFVFCSLLFGGAYEITKFLAGLPGAVFYTPAFSALGVVLYYFLVMSLFFNSAWKNKFFSWGSLYKKQILVCLGLFLIAFCFWRSRPAPAEVHFIDVGQGDAALIITPHRQAVMIDTGGSRTGDFDVGTWVDLPYLRYYGIQQLSCLILTHAHADHAGGSGSILHNMTVQHILIGGEDRQEYAASAHLNPFADPVRSFVQAKDGMKFILDGMTFEILHAGTVKKDANEASNVIKVCYGNYSWLFTGDLTASEEAKMLQASTDVKTTVLKVAHHGSKTSTTEDFLTKSRPVWAVISVGADNSFGHPHTEVLKRLQAHGVRILRTDQQGAVVFRSDGKTISWETFCQ